MKKITLIEISNIFNALLSGEKSREEVAQWAGELAHAYQQKNVEFNSEEEEEEIVSALFYLNGLDVKIGSEEYLYTNDDIIEYRTENGF